VADVSTIAETVALLKATLEATHDGIIVVDLNRRVLLWNAHLLRMFGVTEETLAGGVDAVNAALAVQIDNPDEMRESSRRLWADPSAEIHDTIRFKDGRIYERFIAPHRYGNRITGLVASIRDVTHTATTRQALEQHRTFLEQAQEVAHIGSWVAELDGSGRVGWSRETHRIFGIQPKEFAGTRDAFYEFVHPEDRAVVAAAAQRARERSGRSEVDHRIIRRDGMVRWVHLETDVVRDADGRPLRMLGTVQDVTERRQLEDQLRQAQKMEAIGRLAGGIAHDINNALTAIAGYAELAFGEIPVGTQARADVDEIRRAAERAGAVTKQLLAFSRKQLIEPRLFNLNDTVAAIGRMLSRLVGSDIVVRTELSNDLRPIIGDPGQIEQAIVNLAVNARDAMPDGGELTLSTAFKHLDEAAARMRVPMPPGDYVCLSVRDTGHGMSPDTLARIFEPFFTTKPAGKGTGLGLSMVYGTLKQIGGFVFVESELGHGTTFTLYFPPAAEAELSATSTESAPAGSRATILVAEDEAAVRNLVASALRDEYEVLTAASAEDALDIAGRRSTPIDLLLTDAIMPGQSGVELAAALVERWPSVRVLFMSGYTEDDLSIALAGHVPSILQKPFTPRDLRRRIREMLDTA
jgi:PAS domain S-box-containing protein